MTEPRKLWLLICAGGGERECPPLEVDPRTIDVTSTGHTDQVCPECGGPMVVEHIARRRA